MWPKNIVNNTNLDDVNAEIKSSQIHVHANTFQGSIVALYSSYTTLIRIVAWILRYAHNSRKCNKLNRIVGPLSVDELNASMLTIVRTVQL